MQITANGIQIECEVYGPDDGVPLVLVRGLGSQLVHWPREFVQGFADLGYRTVIFDNRDVGLSQRCPADGVTGVAEDILAEVRKGALPSPAYSLDDMALDTLGVMDAFGMAKAHVFGISMGGAITQVLVGKHADRLLSTTIVMTAARLISPGLIERVLVYPETREEAQESWIEGHASWGSHGYPMSETEIREQAALAWDRGSDANGVNRQALATMSYGDRREMLTTINHPCFVLHGAIDTLIPPEMGEEIAALIPNSELKIIEGMGHVITPLLSPMIVEMVHDFINRRGLSA
jgi:pimeloyl-ACP methyl ester carboxylesterase